jgi:predicted RNA-binding Zn ribbon-like protein
MVTNATIKGTRKRGRDQRFPRLLGERLCLDFVNTVESPRAAHPQDYLKSYVDLAYWGRHVSMLNDATVGALVRAANERPETAQGAFADAIAFRAVLERIFRAVAAGETPLQADIADLQDRYAAHMANVRLTPESAGFALTWPEDPADLTLPLHAVIRSAVAVLTTDDLKRVRQCPGANDCGWLFYDTSKNASRRWCSMEGCGSRVKMRHHYARHKGQSA